MSLLKRPLWAVGIFGFGGLVACTFLPFWGSAALAVGCFIVAALCLFRRSLRRVSVCLLAAMVAVLGFLSLEAFRYRPLKAFDGKTVSVHATVTETGKIAHGVLCVTVRADGGDLPAGTKLLLRVPFNDLPPVCGDEVNAVTAVELLSDTSSDYTLFDSRKADHTILSGWVEKEKTFSLLRKDDRSLPKTLAQFRAAVADELLSGMTQDVRPLLTAMCLGDKTFLDDETTDSFRRSGVSHLLVVSGLHVSIVAMGIYGLLRKLRVRRKTASVAALVSLVAFALLVGLHPSVVRACVLNALVLSGNLFRRRADGLNSLGCGLLMLWICNPYCVYDVGLWLSFGATFGLLWLLPRMTRFVNDRFSRHSMGIFERPLRFAAESLCVTLAATLPILPICAVVFGEISLVAPLTNLLAVFAATLLLWCAVMALLCSVVSLGFFAGAFRLCATVLARYLLGVTGWLGGLSHAVVSTDESYRQWWVIGTLAVVVILWKLYGKRAAFAGFAVTCVILAAMCIADNTLSKGTVYVTLTRAYGDNAVLLEKDGERCLLVDGGNGWNAAKRLIDRENAPCADTVVVVDSNRKLGRKWLEFNDRVAVGQYVLLGFSEKVIAAMEKENETVSVAEKAALFENTVSVCLDSQQVILTASNGETVVLDLTGVQDATFRMRESEKEELV